MLNCPNRGHKGQRVEDGTHRGANQLGLLLLGELRGAGEKNGSVEVVLFQLASLKNISKEVYRSQRATSDSL